MNEDKFFKDMLVDYRPQLSDDNAFMQKLQRQMTNVAMQPNNKPTANVKEAMRLFFCFCAC